MAGCGRRTLKSLARARACVQHGSSQPEEALAVELELGDGFADVVQGSMGVGLLEALHQLRTPAAGQFLDGGYVDDAVVQVVVELKFYRERFFRL